MDSLNIFLATAIDPSDERSPNTMYTKLVAFTIFETFILMLNVVFICLIILYIKKFGIQSVDKYILSSFCLLAMALILRNTTNFYNYSIGFRYINDNPNPSIRNY